jgi:hypothetical protein
MRKSNVVFTGFMGGGGPKIFYDGVLVQPTDHSSKPPRRVPTWGWGPKQESGKYLARFILSCCCHQVQADRFHLLFWEEVIRHLPGQWALKQLDIITWIASALSGQGTLAVANALLRANGINCPQHANLT